MDRFSNFHSHKMWTNTVVADCPLHYKDYIDRCIELNQSVITSVEHGFQGNPWLLNEMILNKNIEFKKRRKKGEKNVPRDLKFVFGVEAYWVKNRFEKDKSNCHIVLLAKNENGRRKINLALSIANEEEAIFNGKPRVDLELLLSLPKNDVFITSACIAYWNKYEDIDEITLKLHDYFGDNFMLEVQNHDTEKQKEVNRHILDLSKKYGIKIICGLDTHVINTTSQDSSNDNTRRDKILENKNMKYEDEYGWHIDYPDCKTIYERFKQQGVLSDKEIISAMENTFIIEDFEDVNLGLKIIEDGDNIYLDTEIKVPTLYPTKTQEERDALFKQIINNEWKNFKEKENIPDEEVPMYLEGIRYEVGEVIASKMTDYFLLHYVGLKRGVDKYGGIITKRGRGSGVGFFINTLLGFSKVDRFKAPIKLYPERFLTADRILKSKTAPDIDNNIVDQEPFVEAFRDLLGEHGIYPMISFKPLQKSSAIKLYMKAEGIEPTIQNNVTKQLKEYEDAIKHCDTDEERDEIDINDYISEEYVKYIDLSKPYQGIVLTKSAHACAFLLLDGDIREEIGLFRCISESNNKSTLTACIEGTMADHYKYLKTDLLIVDVVGLTEAIWKRIGLPSPSNTQLERMLTTEKGNKAWEMYERGLTLCVNQCEKPGTMGKCKRYKMKTTAELSAFVAAIRPAFGSLINNFLDRKDYTTGVPQLDEVLHDSYSYMLYQESIMAFLNWLGIDMKETYDIVKKISKKVYQKHPEQMEELKKRCKPMWLKNTGSMDKFDETFKTVELAGSYAFNSAHSYCVGNDGAEIAYTKANYPFETYEVCLNWFDKKKNKNKVALLKQEMKEGFNISVGEMKWGKDNRKFTLDKKNNCIYPSLSSIKGIGDSTAEELYDLYKSRTYNSFIELVIDIKTKTNINSASLDTLIKLDYFSGFGKSQKLLKTVDLYDNFYAKKQFKKDNLPCNISCEMFRKYSSKETKKMFKEVNLLALALEVEKMIPDKDIPTISKIKTQREKLGYISYRNIKLDKKYVLIGEINTKYTPTIETMSLNSGVSIKCKIPKKIYRELKTDDIIYIQSMEKKQASTKVGEDENGKPIFEKIPNKFNWWIKSYSIIKDIDAILEELDGE